VLERAREPLEICASCAGSPLCDRCGHARSKHTGVFDRGRAGCSVIVRDFQSLSSSPCPCPGFESVRGPLRDATVAAPDPDPL